jgi:hypothetical protein
VISQHDNGYFWSNVFNLIGDGCTIHQTQVVLEDNGVNGPRREEPQSVGPVGCGCDLVSAFLQQTQLIGIPVYAQQGAVANHTVVYTGRRSRSLFTITQLLDHSFTITQSVRKESAASTEMIPRVNLVNFDQSSRLLSLNTGTLTRRKLHVWTKPSSSESVRTRPQISIHSMPVHTEVRD